MKTVDSCYLLGAALDWAVAKAEGLELATSKDVRGVITLFAKHPEEEDFEFCPAFSVFGSESHEIIEREKITTIHVEDDDPNPIEDGPWAASVKDLDYGATGPTALIAAMRCYVCLKLGDTIEIPDELVNGG